MKNTQARTFVNAAPRSNFTNSAQGVKHKKQGRFVINDILKKIIKIIWLLKCMPCVELEKSCASLQTLNNKKIGRFVINDILKNL